MNHDLYRWAKALALITVVYNFAEAVASLWFGYDDESLVLFGFGVDSLVEVISALGVWHMIGRITTSPDLSPDRFERTALRITGTSFYLLALGLTISAAVNIATGHHPETTLWGIIISLTAIVCMWLLVHYKTKVGKALASQAILADAACSKVCLYLSVILLVASAGYELTGLGFLDAAGSLFIAWFAAREGREAFGKAKGIACHCCAGGCASARPGGKD